MGGAAVGPPGLGVPLHEHQNLAQAIATTSENKAFAGFVLAHQFVQPMRYDPLLRPIQMSMQGVYKVPIKSGFEFRLQQLPMEMIYMK